MAAYYLSDVHLRLDRPERSLRLERFVDDRRSDDELVIGGDLCDFWMASRQADEAFAQCRGLRSLARFRDRGGRIAVIAGNHDLWFGPWLQRFLDVSFTPEPFDRTFYGTRVRLVHGHLTGGRAVWKRFLEHRAFYQAFRRLPDPLALLGSRLLDRTNDATRAASERRSLDTFKSYARQAAGQADIVVFGHLHQPADLRDERPRVIVLGGWMRGSCYLKIDERGFEHVVQMES